MLGSVPVIKNNDAVVCGERMEGGLFACFLMTSMGGEGGSPDFFMEGFFIEITYTYLFSQRALGLKPRSTTHQEHTEYVLLNSP